jgi:integrase
LGSTSVVSETSLSSRDTTAVGQVASGMLEACERAKIRPAVSFHVFRHTHGSTLAMRGVPMGVIAEQLGHADTRMTEKHYAHLAPSYVAQTIRAHSPTLGLRTMSP